MILLFAFVLATADTLDLSLEQALAIARDKGTTSADARLDSASGQARFLRGWSAVVPSLNSSGGVNWRRSENLAGRDTTTHSWSLSFGASQVLFDASAIGAVAQGYAGRAVYNLQSVSKLTGVDRDVRTGYYGLQKVYGLREVARNAVQSAAENLNLAEQKFRFGKATQLDVLRSRVFEHQAQLNLMDAEKALLTANEGFKAQLGLADNRVVRPVPVDTALSVVSYATFDDFWQNVQASNLSLQLARKSEQVTRLARRIAYGRMLPSLSASVSHGYSGEDFPTPANWGKHDGMSYGIGLSLPIFNIKEIALDIRDANIDLDRARIASRSAEIQLREAAVGAYLAQQQAMRQVSYAAENVRLNEQLYRLAQEQSRLGQLTMLDLFNVETTLAQARTSYLSAICDVQIQQAQIDYLLGK